MEIKAPGAHLDHMLRQTRMHNMQLSTMADMKASMLLTVSSLVLGLALSKLAISPHDPVFVILLIGSVLTIGFAIFATLPKAGPSPIFRKTADTDNPNFTILFFGDYSNLSYEDYSKKMEHILNDPSATYEAQIREIYNLGRYLAKHKFQKLRFAYLTFLSGVLGSAVCASVKYFAD